jgi:hypothetical protein
MPVKTVRMDGTGENKKLQKRSNSSDWKLNISYEIMAQTPLSKNI